MDPNNPAHLMVDIETMGMAPDGAIVQIGYAVFNPITGFVLASADINVSLASSVQAGMTLNPGTIEWWMKQEQAARDALYTPPPCDLALGLSCIQAVYQNAQCGAVWAFPATFDVVILESAFRLTKEKVPWGYRDIRDARTWIRQALTREECVSTGLKHLASNDCLNQIRWLMDASRKLNVPLK